MKIGVIGAGTMGQGIAKAFAQVEGNTVALCDIKQEWAENGLAKIKKGYEKLVAKGKMTQEKADAIVAAITPGLKEDLCADCDLIVEAAEAKLIAARTASDVTRRCLQLFGGYGYTRDYPIERMMRDAKITEIYEGTSEVQMMVISGALLK